MAAAKTITTREFFEEFIPAAVEAHEEMATTIEGSVCMIVQGEGAWTLRFMRGRLEVEEEIDFDADLVATFSAERFEDLLRGRSLDPDSEDPICLGDTTLLERLGRVLSPPSRGGLGAQLAFRKKP